MVTIVSEAEHLYPEASVTISVSPKGHAMKVDRDSHTPIKEEEESGLRVGIEGDHSEEGAARRRNLGLI